jgi:uncharacterized protein involved in outer membrane biogenesis
VTSSSDSPGRPSRSRRLRARRIALWTGAVVTVLAITIVLVLSITNWNFARGTVASFAGSKLNRTVRLEGDLTAHLLSRHPSVRIEKIIVSSPDWVGDRDLAVVERIDFAIDLKELLTGDLVFDTLTIEKPNVALISDAKRRSNFNFAKDDGSSAEDGEPREAPTLPAVRRFTVRGGELYVRDEIHKLVFSGTVEANERSDKEVDEPFRLRGEGMLNDEPFALLFKGAALVNIKVDEPYEFSLDVTAGKTAGAAHGMFARPFDFASLAAAIDIKGENLAHLYYLTNLALPFTPPYRLSGNLHTSKKQIEVEKLDGKVGNSDIGGKLSIDLNGARPKLVADLRSDSLNLADLSPAVGRGINVDSDGDALDSVAPAKAPSDKLFPTYQFQFDRLAVMDADVRLFAASVQTKKLPLKEVGFRLQLDNSVLKVDPLVFVLPQGKIAATVQVDAREKIAKNTLDIRAVDIQLDQFKGKTAKEAPLDGTLQARMQISGTGNSVHDLASNADGKFNAVIPHGEVRRAFAELAGINVARGLGLLLAKDESRAEVRCGIAIVDIKDGSADIDQLIFDTKTVLIKGDGIIELEPEKVDLDFSGHPKKFQLVRLRAPITVNGPLRKPNVGVDAGDAAKQVGIAAAIGALLTPLASALAFIDPGLTKDENCAALLTEAQQAQKLAVQPANSTWSVTTLNELPSSKKF